MSINSNGMTAGGPNSQFRNLQCSVFKQQKNTAKFSDKNTSKIIGAYLTWAVP